MCASSAILLIKSKLGGSPNKYSLFQIFLDLVVPEVHVRQKSPLLSIVIFASTFVESCQDREEEGVHTFMNTFGIYMYLEEYLKYFKNMECLGGSVG